MPNVKQFTEEEAIAFAVNKCYEGLTAKQIVEVQLFQRRICLPLNLFHKSLEIVLDRPILRHEFINQDALIKEYLGEKERPSLEDILNLIPKENRIVAEL